MGSRAVPLRVTVSLPDADRVRVFDASRQEFGVTVRAKARVRAAYLAERWGYQLQEPEIRIAKARIGLRSVVVEAIFPDPGSDVTEAVIPAGASSVPRGGARPLRPVDESTATAVQPTGSAAVWIADHGTMSYDSLLHDQPYVVGRDSSADIRIDDVPASSNVARKHLRVTWRDGGQLDVVETSGDKSQTRIVRQQQLVPLPHGAKVTVDLPVCLVLGDGRVGVAFGASSADAARALEEGRTP
jgi:hypothetical protein